MKSLLLALALALNLPALHAQQTVAPAPYVFHAYSNVLQIPVLTLSPNQKILPPGTPLQFNVSIDGGPPFPIHHVRLEGSDAISLSIVLDMTGNQKRLVDALDETTVDKTAIDESIQNWVRQSLQPIDRVSVYAVDCTMLQTATNIPADGTTLTQAIDAAVHSTSIHQENRTPSTCISNTTALLEVITGMSKLHGRHVILAVGRGRMAQAVTTGDDMALGDKWRELTALANTFSVAVFGLEESSDYPANYKDPQDRFNILCQLSGGLILNSDPGDAEDALQHFIALVRDRYIVEFPRPDSLASGWHLINVSVADTKMHYFVRSSGASAPAADQSLLNDPTTLSSDPTSAPTPGKPQDSLAALLHTAALQAKIKIEPTAEVGDDQLQNRLQIPVLAFAKDQGTIQAGTVLPFLISVDGQSPTPPERVRPQGADPISLSIALDVSGDQKRILSTIDATVANFVSQSLYKPDYVSVYAVDCSVVQTADDVKADGAAIEHAVSEAMQSTAVHKPEKDQSACMGHGEALSRIVDQISTLNGRHVILAVGPRVLYGHPYPDFSANIDDPLLWQALNKRINASSVTVFGLEEGDPYTAVSKSGQSAFDLLCQKSGGIVLGANQKDVAPQLQHFIDLLRGRYILEFKMPENSDSHHFAVSMGQTKTPYFIYPSGFTMPIGDRTSFDEPPATH